jgi:hypothetical protein
MARDGMRVRHRTCAAGVAVSIALGATALGVTLFLAGPVPLRAAPAPDTIGIELNRLEEQGGNCRAYLVFANPGAASYASFKLDLVVFDRKGVIARRVAVEAGPLRPAKTTVKLFDIPETACAGIGTILVNDVVACRAGDGELPDCIERVAVSSKLDVALTK